MSKKKNSKVKDKKKSLNDRFIYMFRMINLKSSSINLENYFKELAMDDLIETVQRFKEWYEEQYEYLKQESFDKLLYIENLDYFIEAVILFKDGKLNREEAVKYLKDKLYDLAIKRDVNLEMLMANARVITRAGLIRNKNARNLIYEIYYRIAQVLFSTAYYTSSYLEKPKNKEAKEVILNKDTSKLEIIYSNKELLTEKEIEDIIEFYRSNDGLNDKKSFIVRNNIIRVLNNINTPLNIFIKDEKGKKFLIYQNGKFFIKDYKGNIPLKTSKGNYLLETNEIRNPYKNRRYLIPKGGIYFDVIDKSSIVHHIEMIEDKENFYINIYLKNNDDIFIESHESTSFNKNVNEKLKKFADNTPRLYKEELFPVSCYISKTLFENEVPEDGIMTVSCRVSNNECNGELSYDLTYLIFACIYIAYCNPTLFKGVLNLHGLERKENSNGFKKSRYYKAAYIRRLPKGSKMSETAKLNAKEEGFLEVPQGYTFVRASNVDLLDDEKSKIVHIR